VSFVFRSARDKQAHKVFSTIATRPFLSCIMVVKNNACFRVVACRWQ
jgi:hypothetical protein